MDKRTELSGGNVLDLAAVRVARVKQLARQVAESQSTSGAAFERLRQTVAGELLNQGSIQVTEEAMNALSGEEAQMALRMAVKEANQVFYYEERAIAAVVVPVAVRYLSPSTNAVAVWHGQVDSMRSLAAVVKNATRATKVVFDARFYRAGQLLGAKARDLREHLLAMEKGEVGDKALTKPALLRSGPESPWEVIYFLGAAIFDIGTEGALSDPGVEDKLRKHGCHAEWAMDQADPVAWSQGVEAKAKCLGYYSLHRGIQVGEDRLRTLQLDSLVSSMELGVVGTLFEYAIDAEADRIRLLVTTGPQRAEFVWKRYGEEGTGAFRKALDEVISERVADVRDIQELPLAEYRAIARKKGIVW